MSIVELLRTKVGACPLCGSCGDLLASNCSDSEGRTWRSVWISCSAPDCGLSTSRYALHPEEGISDQGLPDLIRAIARWNLASVESERRAIGAVRSVCKSLLLECEECSNE